MKNFYSMSKIYHENILNVFGCSDNSEFRNKNEYRDEIEGKNEQ